MRNLGITLRTLGRPIKLGALAGLLVSSPYLLFIAMHSAAYNLGYYADLGGSTTIINGVRYTLLPPKLAWFVLALTFFWGLLLSRLTPPDRRPQWWVAAPISWISVGITLLCAKILGAAEWYVSLISYGSLGLLFGLVTRSVISAVFGFLLFPIIFLVSVIISHVVPFYVIVNPLFDQNKAYEFGAYGLWPFFLSVAAIEEAAQWVVFGILSGVTIHAMNYFSANVYFQNRVA